VCSLTALAEKQEKEKEIEREQDQEKEIRIRQSSRVVDKEAERISISSRCGVIFVFS